MNEADTGAVSVEPSEGTSDSPSDGLADDLFGSEGPPSEHETTSKGTSDKFDPSSVDIRRTKLEEIPEAHRHLFEPAYKALGDMEAGITKRDQDLQEQLRTSQAAEKEWRDKIQEITTSQQQNTTTDAQQNLQQQLNDPNLTPVQRQGIQTVQQIVDAATQPMQGMLETVQQLRQAVHFLTQQSTNQLNAEVNKQIAAAKSMYGEDVENYATQINALASSLNPITGEKYTVKEAYELVAGKAQMNADELRKADEEAKKKAKTTITSPTGTPVVVPETGGEISEAEARAGISALPGFE